MPASEGPGDSIESCTAEDFKTALVAHMARCAEGQDRVVLDFAGVEYISSVGLRVLMLASKQAKAQRGALGIAALQPAVGEIFDISRFTMVLDVFPSVREGLARLSPKALAAFDAACRPFEGQVLGNTRLDSGGHDVGRGPAQAHLGADARVRT